jgi:hypothetical protein
MTRQQRQQQHRDARDKPPPEPRVASLHVVEQPDSISVIAQTEEVSEREKRE